MSLIRNALKTLAKSVLKPLGLTAAASAIDPAIHKKIFGSGFITLIISNEEMEDMMKIRYHDRFLGMLLGTLGASLLG